MFLRTIAHFLVERIIQTNSDMKWGLENRGYN